MSRETDSIVAKHKASRLGGHVTSITSSAPGRASGTYHERRGSPSPSDKVGKGLAVDFGDDSGNKATPTKLAIFNLFAQDSSKLAELFYAFADFYVKNGIRYPIANLDRSIWLDHRDHCHVAVSKGVYLPSAVASVVKEPVAIIPARVPEDGMPIPTSPTDAALTPSGAGAWRVQWDGGVITSGDAQFHGSMGGKQNPFGFVSIAPTITGRGYWLLAEDGGVYSFGDAEHLGSYWSIAEKDRQGIRSFVSITAHADGDGWCILGTDGSWWHVRRADRDAFAKIGRL